MSRMVGGTFGVAVMGALITGLGRSQLDELLPEPARRAARQELADGARRRRRRGRAAERRRAPSRTPSSPRSTAACASAPLVALVGAALAWALIAAAPAQAQRGRTSRPPGPRSRRWPRPRSPWLRPSRASAPDPGASGAAASFAAPDGGPRPRRRRPHRARSGSAASSSGSTSDDPGVRGARRCSAAILDLPPLALEDSQEFGQRPKLDDYGDRVLLVFYGAEASDDEPVEVHLHLAASTVVTVRRDACASCPPAPGGRGGRRPQRGRPRLPDPRRAGRRAGPARRRRGHARRGRRAWRRAFERPSDMVRRDIVRLRGAAVPPAAAPRPQRDMLAAGAELLERLPGLERAAARHPFRDVHDVLVLAVSRGRLPAASCSAEAVNIYLSSDVQPPQRARDAAGRARARSSCR